VTTKSKALASKKIKHRRTNQRRPKEKSLEKAEWNLLDQRNLLAEKPVSLEVTTSPKALTLWKKMVLPRKKISGPRAMDTESL
jgi:hypothetical protein